MELVSTLAPLVSLGGFLLFGLFAFVSIKWILSLRRVVSTNQVHIIQKGKKTISYGKDHSDNGNVYYEWPVWLPLFGVTKTMLPISVFNIDLIHYDAYDQDRVPFLTDVKAFFRINDSSTAAARVSSFEELEEQLTGIVQGAVRSMLAKAKLEEIMSERSVYGQRFTDEVTPHLKEWGVIPVRNIELMDIRDAKDSQVIHNIMAKKKSHIESESRIEVAKNNQMAEQAEIDAQRQVDLQKQEAEQVVGLRKATVTREVGIANEIAQQEIKEQSKTTKEKDMAVIRVQSVKQAEIDLDVNVVKARQDKETTVIVAEGVLEQQKRKAEGIKVEGEAKAAAEQAILMAPVEAQIALAKEIGGNDGYQKYLLGERQISASKDVGIAQAKALELAEVKVIANTGNPTEGISNVMDLFTSKGGTHLGAMLEGIVQSPTGKAVIERITPKG